MNLVAIVLSMNRYILVAIAKKRNPHNTWYTGMKSLQVSLRYREVFYVSGAHRKPEFFTREIMQDA